MTLPGVVIHDLVLEYAITKAREDGSEKSWYISLLNSYYEDRSSLEEDCRQWWAPFVHHDRYLHANLCRLLEGAEYAKELVALTCKPEWTAKQLNVEGILQLEQDVEKALGKVSDVVDANQTGIFKEGLKLIVEAARLSSSFATVNPREVWFQLYGRLLKAGRENTVIQAYLRRIENCAPRPWLRPVNECLISAGHSCTQVIVTGSKMWRMASTSNPRLIVCGGFDGMITVVDIASGDVVVKRLAHDSWVYGLVVSKNGKVISSSGDGTVKVWNLESMELERLLQYDTGATCLALSPDGETLLTGFDDGSINVWNIGNGELRGPAFGREFTPEWQRLPAEERTECPLIASMRVTPDGEYVVAGDSEGTVCTWNIHTGQRFGAEITSECSIGGHIGVEVRTKEASRDEWEVLTSGLFQVRRWNLQSGECLNTWRQYGPSIALSMDGQRLFSVNSDLQVWDVEQGARICVQSCGAGCSHGAVVLSADERKLITCSLDETVRVWDVSRVLEAMRHDEPQKDCSSVAIFSDGKRVACGNGDKVCIWDVSTGRPCPSSPKFDHGDLITCGAVTANDESIVSARFERSIIVWDLVSGQKRMHSRTPRAPNETSCSCIQSLALTADGTRAITGSRDGIVHTWYLTETNGDPREIGKHQSSVENVVLSQDERRVVSVTQEEIVVWDLETGECKVRVAYQDAPKLGAMDILLTAGESGFLDDSVPWVSKYVRQMQLDVWGTGNEFARQVNVGWGESVLVLGTFEGAIRDFSFHESSKLLALIVEQKVAFLYVEV